LFKFCVNILFIGGIIYPHPPPQKKKKKRKKEKFTGVLCFISREIPVYRGQFCYVDHLLRLICLPLIIWLKFLLYYSVDRRMPVCM
jgi:hypothetical protein